MDTFTFDHEITLVDGMRAGLGKEWQCALDWITVHAHDGMVDIKIRPPASKPLFRWRELILQELSEEQLHVMGKVVGHETAIYLHKYRRFIAPAALAA